MQPGVEGCRPETLQIGITTLLNEYQNRHMNEALNAIRRSNRLIVPLFMIVIMPILRRWSKCSCKKHCRGIQKIFQADCLIFPWPLSSAGSECHRWRACHSSSPWQQTDLQGGMQHSSLDIWEKQANNIHQRLAGNLHILVQSLNHIATSTMLNLTKLLWAGHMRHSEHTTSKCNPVRDTHSAMDVLAIFLPSELLHKYIMPSQPTDTKSLPLGSPAQPPTRLLWSFITDTLHHSTKENNGIGKHLTLTAHKRQKKAQTHDQ